MVMIATATALFIKPLDLDMLDHIDFKIWYRNLNKVREFNHKSYIYKFEKKKKMIKAKNFILI